MLLSRLFGRQNARETRRPSVGRQLHVESLEGRRLLSTLSVVSQNPAALSGIQGNHIGVSAIQGNHIGAPAIQGNHIGTSNVQGAHIGFEPVDVAVLPSGGSARKH